MIVIRSGGAIRTKWCSASYVETSYVDIKSVTYALVRCSGETDEMSYSSRNVLWWHGGMPTELTALTSRLTAIVGWWLIGDGLRPPI